MSWKKQGKPRATGNKNVTCLLPEMLASGVSKRIYSFTRLNQWIRFNIQKQYEGK